MESLYVYWAKHPPLHIIAAAFTGVTPSEKKKQIADIRDLFDGPLPPEFQVLDDQR